MNPTLSYRDALKKLQCRNDLEAEEAASLLEAVFKGELSEIQVAGLLAALAVKGESVSEIIGFAQVLRHHGLRLRHQYPDLVDTAGTGGDTLGTFNISTTAAFVIAGAGVPVAKHGNRAISSRCGSADVLGHLGVKIDASLETLESCLVRCGMTFLFAPIFHQAMRTVANVRKGLGVRTIFNILGPLANPAHAKRQVIGVFSLDLTEKLAEALRKLGCDHALVLAGEDGLDEISLSGRTRITEVKRDVMRTFWFEPESLGLKRQPLAQILGGEPEVNSKMLRAILDRQAPGAGQDIVLANAAAGIYVSGRVASLEAGFNEARKSLESGAALKKLEQLVACSNDVQPVDGS
ncbi:MAG: anthranilate phosphoribosyltransferase [Acidobacteriota bacterium]